MSKMVSNIAKGDKISKNTALQSIFDYMAPLYEILGDKLIVEYSDKNAPFVKFTYLKERVNPNLKKILLMVSCDEKMMGKGEIAVSIFLEKELVISDVFYLDSRFIVGVNAQMREENNGG